MISQEQQKLRAAIVGATGYTGSEMVRILSRHPHVDIEMITSESHAGESLTDVHPHFQDINEQRLESADELLSHEIDVAFLALPHGVSMDFVRRFRDAPFRIVDLSGDYRLSSPAVYGEWYAKEHTDPEGFEGAVYGLPELHRSDIVQSRLVANPGCYPTCSILGAFPLLDAGLVDPAQIIVDAKSGITGAGIKPKPTTHYPTVSDNFRAYGLKTHRHTIEIEEQLAARGASPGGVQFTPHLLPVDRGILATIYMTPLETLSEQQVQDAYASRFEDEPFVRLRNEPPTLKDVRGSNYCDIFVTIDERTQRVITLAAIDNLVKGAAGQAVQNMNIMFGLPETVGLTHVPMNP